MYFGDWLRSSEMVNNWYLSYRSEEPDFLQRIDKALQRNGRAVRLSSTCILLESTEILKTVIKKIKPELRPGDEAIILYHHHRRILHSVLAPPEDD